jgi:CBS domain-containing protein
MPYSVQHLVEGRPSPITAVREDKIKTVLSRMVEYDFSQLPVVDSENHPVGMVTYESILRGIRNFKVQIDDLSVREVMISAPKVNMEDDLFEVLETLKQTNAVLIVDAQSKLVGIVTSYDSTEYFRKRAENLMRVEDIETMIKDFIQVAYTRDDGQLDEVELSSVISRVTSHEKVDKDGKPKEFDDLSLSHYISILTFKDKWSFFEPIFKISRDAVGKLLDEVRKTRNGLAHFRDEISADQSDQLRFCADWFSRCSEEYEQIKADIRPLPTSQEIVATVEQKDVVDKSTDSQGIIAQKIDVIAEETKPWESRYAPLADWLNSQPGKIDQVTLTFNKIEEIIGGDLPASARKHRVWWTNSPGIQRHSRMWLETGWRRNRLSMTKEEVSFARIQEREKAYIEFFSELLAKLRQKADFPVREVSPDGASWITFHIVSVPGHPVAYFNYSFSRNRRFRVELYIDTGEQKSTKQIFDHICAHQSDLEAALGEISWERIDDKRASRIALYHPGQIMDDAEKLKKLQEWAADKMIVFYKTVEPQASEAAQQVLQS